MPAPRRLRVLAAVVAALAWTATVAVLLGASHLAAMVWFSGLLVATLAILVAGLLPLPGRRSADGEDGEDTDEDGGGGGGPGPDGEPPWWPDFEQQFREHAQSQDRGRTSSGSSYLRRR